MGKTGTETVLECTTHKWGRLVVDGRISCQNCGAFACELCIRATADSGSCHKCGRQWGSCAEQIADTPEEALEMALLLFHKQYQQMGAQLLQIAQIMDVIKKKKND